MEKAIIKIGISRAVRLSKSILEKYNIKEKIEIAHKKTGIILKPRKAPRKGWAKAFKEMHKAGDDELLLNDVFEDETFEFLKLKNAKK